MALLYMDGFDLQDSLLRWATIGYAGSIGYATPTRFGSGKCILLDVQSAGGQSWLSLTRPVTPAAAQVFVGAALQVGLENGNTNDPTANFFGLYTDSNASGQIYLRRTSTNAIQLYRGDPAGGTLSGPSGTLIASSASGVLDGNWHYVEMSATINATTGNVVVKVDGNTVITFTGNTKNTGTGTNIDGIRFKTGRYVANPIATIAIDDMYICDATGTTNNTFLGDVRVQSMVPNAAGSSTQLTPTGAATNYSNVGETPYNDSTYNASSTVGQRDTYALSDLAAGTTTILGTQSVAHMQKSDAGTANAKVALKSGASVYYDTTQSLGSSTAAYMQVRETDPATSAAWTVAAANALEAGMEVA